MCVCVCGAGGTMLDFSLPHDYPRYYRSYLELSNRKDYFAWFVTFQYVLDLVLAMGV